MPIFQDILLRDQGSASGGASKGQKEIVQQHISHRLRFSLRVCFFFSSSGFFPSLLLDGNMFLLAQAYTSILYLKKFDNFRIILRGKPVEQIRITDELKFKKVVTYKPHAAHDSQVVINIFCNFNPCYLVSYLYHFSPTSNCAHDFSPTSNYPHDCITDMQFGCMSGTKVRKAVTFFFFFFSFGHEMVTSVL